LSAAAPYITFTRDGQPAKRRAAERLAPVIEQILLRDT